ncbi:TonB-dependent receptor [Coralloluteibacterium stylophorae]|uniref:TonB-dependent receptor n=2 Tax=Coralloluteibacterium stylophorae TaxID=1776034 RepID=A0A8J8AXG7_9GAMM|nr:TonB-dependent receptor [Coralloluteibacterium stylophorae]
MGTVLPALVAIPPALAEEPQAIDSGSAAEAGANGAAARLDTISVVGSGSTRATASISQAEILAEAPGISPQNLLGELPGVNVQSTDPYGLYEFGDALRIRGFSSEQVGVTLDGIPLETSDVREGGPISRYVLTENLLDATVSAGSGDVTQPSYHALGGAIRYTSDDPTGVWGGSVSQTLGSDEFVRTFARIDTPEWWSGGPSAYFSAARTRGTQWDNNDATLEADHFEMKVQQAWGMNSLALAWRYNKRDDHDYQSYNLDGSLSWDLNPTASGDPVADASYAGNWTNGRIDSLVSLHGDFLLADRIRLRFVPYVENKRGYGYGTATPDGALTQYENALAGDPDRTDIALLSPGRMAKRLEEIDGDRKGITGSVAWESDLNTLEVGGWYESYEFSQYRPLYNLDEGGDILKDQPFIINYYDRNFDTEVTQVFVKDTLRLLDGRMRLEFGAKGLQVERDFEGIANLDDFYANTTRSTRREDSDWFQPQAGVSFDLGDASQLFANYAENFSAAPRQSLTAGGDTLATLAPEDSENVDLGVRVENGDWSGYIAGYWIAYNNRIIALSDPDPYVVDSTVYQNVGDVETYGVEISGMWRPAPGWRTGASLTLNRSEFQDDYYNSDGSLREVAGNDVPDQPELMFNLNGGYSGEHFFANLEAKYTGDRYGDTFNTEEVPSSVVVNGSLGYQGGRDGPLAGARLQLSVYNLTDTDRIGSVFPNEDYGSYNLLSPRSCYVSLSYDF